MEAEQRPSVVTIAGKIDRQTFERFAMFDAFVRKKGWKNPALFALILSAFALVCFAGQGTHAQAALLGSVLLGVGLLLPLIWFGMFAFSVRRQAKRMDLSGKKTQYTVTLSQEKIHVVRGKETADFSWSETYAAWRVRGCIYLYVSAACAFLLPDCADTEKAWALITSCLPPTKVFVRGELRKH